MFPGSPGTAQFPDANVPIAPGLSISPASGGPHTSVTIVGDGYLAGETVNITYAPTPTTKKVLCVGVGVAGDGSFTCAAQIPGASAAGAPGDHVILAHGVTSNTDTSTVFTLT